MTTKQPNDRYSLDDLASATPTAEEIARREEERAKKFEANLAAIVDRHKKQSTRNGLML